MVEPALPKKSRSWPWGAKGVTAAFGGGASTADQPGSLLLLSGFQPHSVPEADGRMVVSSPFGKTNQVLPMLFEVIFEPVGSILC